MKLTMCERDSHLKGEFLMFKCDLGVHIGWKWGTWTNIQGERATDPCLKS